jgi:hypothetical protein
MSSSVAPAVPRRVPVPAKTCTLINKSANASKPLISLENLIMSVTPFGFSGMMYFRQIRPPQAAAGDSFNAS